MAGTTRKYSPAQTAAAVAVGLAVVTVLVLEAVSAEQATGAVGLVVCGLLVAASLTWLGMAGPAALVSLAFSVFAYHSPVGLDNTFGTLELATLGWLVARTVAANRVLSLLWQVPLLGAAAVALPFRMEPENRDILPDMVILVVAGLAFMFLLGLYLRLLERRRADVYALGRQEQRMEYARDLHDFVAHHVTAIVAQAKAVRYTTASGAPPSPEALDSMLEAIEKTGSQALASMRTMITVLREEAPPARRQLLADVLGEAVRDFPGPPRAVASLSEELRGVSLPAQVVDVVQNVVRESLTNVLRHAADATRVDVEASLAEGDVRVSVTDDGRGGTSGLPNGGFGLLGLTERVEAAGGTLTAGRTAEGWRVTASLPSSLA